MSTYRVEWPCCNSVTETDAWEPESCPFCTAAPAHPAGDAIRDAALAPMRAAVVALAHASLADPKNAVYEQAYQALDDAIRALRGRAG